MTGVQTCALPILQINEGTSIPREYIVILKKKLKLMFSFLKKHQKPLFEGLCDIHNHLLPGIDDGSKNLDTSTKMLHAFEALGFKSTIPTPHIYKELYPNTPTTVKDAFELLKQHKELENTIKVNSYAA